MSWLDLIKAGSDLYGANGDCCPPVVDPYTFLALIAGIGLITWFLQMVIVMTEFMPPGGMRFKRDMHNDRPDKTGIYFQFILTFNNFKSLISVYDLISGVMSEIILDEDGDDDIEELVVQEGFQDDFKTEIKTRRKNFKK